MKIIVIVAVALVIAILFVWLGIISSNKEAKEKGSTEKSYSVWSVIAGFFIGFFVILYEILKEIFMPRKK